MSEGWSTLESVLYPLAGAGGLFIMISVLVLAVRGPRSRPDRGGRGEPIWFGGPGVGEHSDGETDLVLTGQPPRWLEGRPLNWRRAVEAAGDGEETGGASAGW